MKLEIWKYQLEWRYMVDIELPKGAHILTVQTQREVPCIWAIVDTEEKVMEVRHLRIFGTGHPFDIDPPNSKYIGTFQLLGGEFIGHLFELGA